MYPRIGRMEQWGDGQMGDKANAGCGVVPADCPVVQQRQRGLALGTACMCRMAVFGLPAGWDGEGCSCTREASCGVPAIANTLEPGGGQRTTSPLRRDWKMGHQSSPWGRDWQRQEAGGG